MKQFVSYGALVFGVLALSTSAIFVKLADAPSAVTAFYRLFFALLLLIPCVLLSRERRQELRKLSRKRWAMSICSGVLLGIHYILWFESLNYTSVASSTVLVTLQPLFTILFTLAVLREHPGKIGMAGCAIALLGSLIIGFGDFRTGPEAFFGDLLALLAAALISLYFFIGQFVRQDTSATVYSVLGYSGSVVFLLIYALVKGQAFTGYSPRTWGSFLGLALISTILGQFIFNLLLKWLPATSISMSILGEPVGTCILAGLILREGITAQQAVGMVTILGGLAVYFLEPILAKNRKTA